MLRDLVLVDGLLNRWAIPTREKRLTNAAEQHIADGLISDQIVPHCVAGGCQIECPNKDADYDKAKHNRQEQPGSAVALAMFIQAEEEMALLASV